jgi:putative membrane protein insertion efficiency factor
MMSRLLLALLAFYRYFISPCLGERCRFYPSCSFYAQEAIRELGVFKGLTRTIWRLLRCHPWSPGGYDPVIPCKPQASARDIARWGIQRGENANCKRLWNNHS